MITANHAGVKCLLDKSVESIQAKYESDVPDTVLQRFTLDLRHGARLLIKRKNAVELTGAKLAVG